MTITNDTSPNDPNGDSYATNIIQNLDNRSSRAGRKSFVSEDSTFADYYSCFKVRDNEISSSGHLFKFGIDLGS